jgi:signal transduction histidine kinase
MPIPDPEEVRGRLVVEPDGRLIPDRGALELLGLTDATALPGDRFLVLDAEGRLEEGSERPWCRAANGATLDEAEAWIDRFSGEVVHLRVRDEARSLAIEGLATHQALFEMVGQVSKLLVSEEAAGPDAKAVLGRIGYALGAEALLLFVTRAQRVVAQAAHGLDRGDPLRSLEVPPESSSALASLSRRLSVPAALLLEGVDEVWARALASRGLRRIEFLPVGAQYAVVRALAVVRRTARPLDAHQRLALGSVCEVWGTALLGASRREAERKARSSMRALSQAALDRSSEPSLRELLRMLVDLACKGTGAGFGALGVLNREHTELSDFITVGISDEEARRIGPYPRGRGLLGAVILEGGTVRVANMSQDPRSAGFPANHPKMTSFLGVPLRIGRELFGNFYLTDKEDGAEFTDEDAQLLESLSAQAALTVAYARQTGRQRRLLDAVLHHTPHGILFFAGPDSLAFSNAEARRMLDLPGHGAPERRYRLLGTDGVPLPHDEYPAARALAGETVENVEVHIARDGGGTPLPALANAAPVRTETGYLLGAVVALQDLTPFKNLEKMREEFSAVVAHDLRSPLQALMLRIEGLLRHAEGGVVRAPVRTLEQILLSGKRLQHLISDLLDAARIESGHLRLDVRPIALHELVAGLLRQIAPTLGDHPASLEVDGTPAPVAADPLRVEQVLTNLLENAAKYSAKGSPLVVRVASAEGGATASVTDRGPGIAPEELPRLFDRYYQTARAREKHSGLGLGLHIAKGLMEAQGGKLWVESTLTEGSTFHLWLPWAVAPADERAGMGP